VSDAPADGISHWLARLRAGEPEAVRPLWDVYFERLVRYVRSRVVENAEFDANGIAASAFGSFWQAVTAGRLDTPADRNDLWGLLTVITRRKIARLVERRAADKRGGGWTKAPAEVLTAIADADSNPELQAAWADELRAVFDALADPTLERVVLRTLDGWTHREIAGELKCTTRTVANKLRLARQKLTPLLTTEE
jgi:RNA polymerase sigma factor (sigma-70 family)